MINFFKVFKLKNAFVFSLVFGVINWFIFYIILPINTPQLSFETIAFILCSIICFFAGYYTFKFNKTKKKSVRPINYFIIFTIIAFVGLTIRYIDLFFVRDVALGNPYGINKFLKGSNAEKSNVLVVLFGTLRVLYFIPFLILIIQKSKNKVFWFLAISLIIYSSIEVFLFGTRKPFFYLIILIFIALFYYHREKLKPSKKNFLITLIAVLFLGFFSYFIISKRVSERRADKVHLIEITDSRYNDFVKIKDFKLNKLKKAPNSINTKSQILYIHTGQYIVHGVFELNYIIENNFPKAYGLYSFNPIYKLLRRLNFTKKDLRTTASHPRDYVYTTFFGSFFIDFGWFALMFMFLFGAFQRWVFVASKFNVVAKVFVVILLGVNFSMPIFNLLAGTGLYLFIFMFAIMWYSLKKGNAHLSISDV